MLRRLLPTLLLVPAFASAEQFAIDPVHTRVMVAASHAGFSQAIGAVSGSSGRVDFDDGWANAKVDVTLPMQKLDFGDAGWNRAVQNLLATDRFADAHFVSDRVTPRDANHAEICGTLTLHGVSKPLCMDATLNALKRHPMPPFRRTAGFSATAKLDRFDYGIDDWPSVIGRDVELRIEIEASRGIGAPKPDVPAPSNEPTETPTP
ncbi:polyisoprenoid-binding protein [Lysobacter sp. TY2-98]|uniref:YceI family protein n=1 Tax=Lysobacter sp. TY2-98 TaxID=2290922 RepID=UPI000E20447D|nr:polyisoprenoid-binding protein [Lysobacter sp. TY2-98]